MNRAKPGEPLYQCAPADGGTSKQHFASFTRAAPLLQGPDASNEVDAAIGTLLPRIEFEARILDIGPVAGVAKAKCGMRVVKCGSKTAYTEGIITAVDESASVSMSYSGPLRMFHFVRQLRIEPLPPFTRFADAGDSGALVVEQETRKGVGLFFASAGDGSYALANHLTTVLDNLDIELITRS